MKDFNKYYVLPATPEEIYTALTNPLTLELWTGEEAVMSTQAGSEFSLWGGSISGKNLEFEQDKKIVQQWYFDGEPEISIVTIKLHPVKKNMTSVELRQTCIPAKEYEDLVSGWDEHYFGALADFFGDD